MPRHAPLAALLAALLLAPGALHAAGFGGLGVDTSDFGFALPSLNTGEDIQISADHMGADRETQRVTLDGNVRIRFADLTLTSHHASYNRATGDLYAEGDVRIVSAAGGVWEGDSIAFNHRTGEGLMGTGLLRLGSFAVSAPGGASRDDDGVLHARNATLTTCTNEPSAWHWSVTGTGRYKDKEFIELRNATMRLFHVPFLWAPYYYRDLNTHYGWRILPGYTGDWGAYLRLGYVYPIAGNRESDRELYGKTILDLRSERGVGGGQELTWRTEGLLGESTRQWGRLSLYYAYDTDDQDVEDLNWNSARDENRWSVALKERIELSPRDFISVVGEKVSDSQFRDDYDEISVRAASQPLGIANYEHRENTWVGSLALMGPLDTFYAGVRHLPQLRLDTLPRPILGIPRLSYESQTTLGYLRRQPAKKGSALSLAYSYDPGNWAYYDTFRLDTRHILRRPIALADGLTLTPRLGWRGTYYADGPDDALFRSLFEIGATLQARLWRDYDAFRHTLTPYLDLTYVPGSQEGPLDQPYAFDRLDQEYEWRDRFATDGLTPTHRYAGLRFGLRNALQRRNPATLTLSDYLTSDLYGIWVFNTQDHWVRWRHRQQPGRDNLSRPATRVKEDTGLRLLGLNATLKPRRNIILSADAQYDPQENTFAVLDLNGGIRLNAITLYAGYLRRNHSLFDYYWTDHLRDSLLYGGFVHHLCDAFDWSAYIRYNLYYSDLEEIGGYFQYNLDCLSFRLTLDYLPRYYSEDGWKHGSDFRISFGAWIRAFPRDDDEDWMTWGSLANEHALQEPET